MLKRQRQCWLIEKRDLDIERRRTEGQNMTDPQIAIMMLVLFIVIVLLGFPIAFTLIAMGLGFGYYAYAKPDQMDHIFQNNIFDLLCPTPSPLCRMRFWWPSRCSCLWDTSLNVRILLIGCSLVFKLPHDMSRLYGDRGLATCAIFATATGIVGAVVTLMGTTRTSGHVKSGLRQKAGIRCYLCGWYIGYIDTTQYHADCIRGNSPGVTGSFIRGCTYFRELCWRVCI